MPLRIGVNNIARDVSNIYIGVSGVARRVERAYIGVNGVARQFYGLPVPQTEYGITSHVVGMGGISIETDLGQDNRATVGSTVTVWCSPSVDMRVASATFNGEDMTFISSHSGGSARYEFIMPAQDVYIEVSFGSQGEWQPVSGWNSQPDGEYSNGFYWSFDFPNEVSRFRAVFRFAYQPVPPVEAEFDTWDRWSGGDGEVWIHQQYQTLEFQPSFFENMSGWYLENFEYQI